MNREDEIIQRFLPEDPTGLKVWRNQENRFVVATLHYTADPAKRDPKWREMAKMGMPISEWNREYELSWETFEGKPVYGADFREAIHVMAEDRRPDVGIPILRGWDWGLTPACAIGQAVGRRLFLLDEMCETRMGAERFIPKVIEYCNREFPGFSFFDFIDPAGFAESQTDETSCVDIMRRFRLRPTSGDMTYEKRLGAVLRLLTTLEDGVPLLQISPRCKMSIEGFNGAYHYPDTSRKGVVARLDRPVKNEASHIQDGIQYLASKAFSRIVTQPTVSRRVAIPNYAFSRDRR